jgi:hypothetical protein
MNIPLWTLQSTLAAEFATIGLIAPPVVDIALVLTSVAAWRRLGPYSF